MPAFTVKEAATVFIDPLTKGFAGELLKDDDGELRLFDGALMECKLLHRQAHCVVHILIMLLMWRWRCQSNPKRKS